MKSRGSAKALSPPLTPAISALVRGGREEEVPAREAPQPRVETRVEVECRDKRILRTARTPGGICGGREKRREGGERMERDPDADAREAKEGRSGEKISIYGKDSGGGASYRGPAQCVN